MKHLKIVGRSLKWLAAKDSIPADICGSDLYLVEFPKSGITWLSFLIANSILIDNQSSQKITFFNVHQYIPDVQITNGYVGQRIYENPKFRIFKSHSQYNPYYLHLVYMVRNPVSVMRSYHTFLKEHGIAFSSIREFLNNKQYGIQAWRNHVNSWIDNVDQGIRLHLIRYEDLISDTMGSLNSLNANLGLGFSDEAIMRSIDASSMEHMKLSEKIYTKFNPAYRLSFVSGDRIEFSNDDICYINDVCSEEMKRLGY
jgi:hypothetical protein